MAPLAPDAIKLAKRLPPESTFSFPLTSHERVHFLAFLEWISQIRTVHPWWLISCDVTLSYKYRLFPPLFLYSTHLFYFVKKMLLSLNPQLMVYFSHSSYEQICQCRADFDSIEARSYGKWFRESIIFQPRWTTMVKWSISKEWSWKTDRNSSLFSTVALGYI